MARAWVVVMAVGFLIFGPVAGAASASDVDHHGGSSTTAHSHSDDDHHDDDDASTTTPGPPCSVYTPTNVAVSPTYGQPGSTITITGIATPGATVTATMMGPLGSGSADDDDDNVPGMTTYNLGSAVAGPTGQFTITYTLPANIHPGHYTIKVRSSLCPTATTVTFTVRPIRSVSCDSSSSERTFYRGEKAVWNLVTSGWNTAKPVKLRMYKGSYTIAFYNGSWPAGNKVSFQVPSAAPTGDHTMEQSGIQSGSNTKTIKKTCTVKIVVATSLASSSRPLSSGGGPGLPILAPAAAMVAGMTLLRLRFTRRLRTA